MLEKIDGTLHNNRQHGFREDVSCETKVCATLLHDMLGVTDNKSLSVHAAVLNFTKAFDRVSNSMLMEELSRLPNVTEYVLQWVHNILLNRSQCSQWQKDLQASQSHLVFHKVLSLVLSLSLSLLMTSQQEWK